MSDFINRAEQLVKEAIYSFMVERNAERFLACAAPEITLIGVEGQWCKNLQEVVAFTQESIKAHPKAFLLAKEQYFVSPLSEDACCVMLETAVFSKDGAGGILWGSFFVKRFLAQGPKLVHVHVSASERRPIKAIGKLTDINQQKRIQKELENKAHLDPMTKLYHKISAQNQIRMYLANKAKDTLAALLIIDIDNFKTINDTMGHFVGDHVICFIADEMKKLFRNTDVISRFGGDEYMILMKDIYAESLVLEKAALLCKNIIGAFKPEREGYQVTVSIGIAMVEDAPITYQQLFQRADKALYNAKNKGKNRFEIYTSTTEAERFNEEALRKNKGLVKFYAPGQSYQMIVDTALDILLQSQDTETAVTSILRFLGASLKLSQTYTSIFLQGKIKVLAQWSSYDISPLPSLIDLDKDALLANFNSDGVFLASDTSALPSPAKEVCAELNNGALLQSLIYKDNQIIGFAGFSDSKVLRVWTQSEIDILQTVTKIVTDTVIKIAAQEK